MKFRLLEAASFVDVDIDDEGILRDSAGNVIGSTKGHFGNRDGSTGNGENLNGKEEQQGQEQGQGQKQGQGQEQGQGQGQGQGKPKPGKGKGKGNGPKIKSDGKLYHDPRYTGTWKFKVSDEDAAKYGIAPEDLFYDAGVDDAKYGDVYNEY